LATEAIETNGEQYHSPKPRLRDDTEGSIRGSACPEVRKEAEGLRAGAASHRDIKSYLQRKEITLLLML
jgi:hypothetical protein